MPDVFLLLPPDMWTYEVIPYLRVRDLLSLRTVTRFALSFFTLEVAPVLRQMYIDELSAFNRMEVSEEQVAAREMVALCRRKLMELPEALMYVRTYTEHVHDCIHMAMAMFCFVLQPASTRYSMKDIKRILKVNPAKLQDRFLRLFLSHKSSRNLTQLRSWQTWSLADVMVSCDMAGLLMELVELFFQFQNYMKYAGEEARAYVRRSENCRQFEKCIHKLANLKMPIFRRSFTSFRRPQTGVSKATS